MDQWHLNKMKVILTVLTLNYVDCVSFFCIDSLHNVYNQKSYSRISKKHDQTFTNLVNVFDF